MCRNISIYQELQNSNRQNYLLFSQQPLGMPCEILPVYLMFLCTLNCQVAINNL